MIQPPLTFLERRWKDGKPSGGNWNRGFGDRMIAASQWQPRDSRWNNPLDVDTPENISPQARKTLLTLGRWLYWNCSHLRNAINEMVDYAAGTLSPQFDGEDEAWGDAAEEWLGQHDKICDIRGAPYDGAALRKNILRMQLIDGDAGVLLVDSGSGYPFFQFVPAHRICAEKEEVEGGPYDGERILDGVVVNGQGRAVAYAINEGATDPRIVPAEDLVFAFEPVFPDMVRGVSLLSTAIFESRFATDSRKLEMVAQQLAASIGLIETNETGEADGAKKLLRARSSTDFDSDGNRAVTSTETIDGVTVRYHRAGSGSKLESFRADRPTLNQQEFRNDTIREALAGIGWSWDFSLNPTKAGGASMRIVLDKVNSRVAQLRKCIGPAVQRMNQWRIAKAIKLGLLPTNDDWWRWAIQGGARLTADAKYDSDVSIMRRRTGEKTLEQSVAEGGGDWRNTRAQREVEADDLLTRAKAVAKRHDVTIELAMSILEQTTQFSNVTFVPKTNPEEVKSGETENPEPPKSDES